eukprot:54285-Rhodomonas_salina.1
MRAELPRSMLASAGIGFTQLKYNIEWMEQSLRKQKHSRHVDAPPPRASSAGVPQTSLPSRAPPPDPIPLPPLAAPACPWPV